VPGASAQFPQFSHGRDAVQIRLPLFTCIFLWCCYLSSINILPMKSRNLFE
jgi:uncharacterized membrane protein YadS